MSPKPIAALILCAGLTAGTAVADPADALLADYRAGGAGPFDAAAGESLWLEPHPGPEGPRACTDCHTADLHAPGRHRVTGKAIDPMAPSATPARLSDGPKIEKWFRRNCQWTLGRECTAQEKGDLLTYIRSR